MTLLSRLKRWKWSLPLFLTGGLYFPTLKWLVLTWKGNPYYSHGFLIPCISAILSWRAWRQSEISPPENASAGLLFLGLGILGHLWAFWRELYIFSALSLLLTLGGLVLLRGGKELCKRQSFPLVFLLFAIPFPWLEKSTPSLARHIAAWAGKMA